MESEGREVICISVFMLEVEGTGRAGLEERCVLSVVFSPPVLWCWSWVEDVSD